MKWEARASQPGLPCTVRPAWGVSSEMFVTGRGSWVSAVEVVSAAWKEAVRKDLVLLLPMGMAGQSRTWLSAECNLVANLVTNPCRRGSS